MESVFWFALVLGGGLLVISLLGGVFEGMDMELDADLDADLGADMGTDVDTHGHGAGHSVVEAFSVRNLTYFLFGFGATGVLLGWTGVGLPLTLAASGGVGVIAAALSAVAFRWLRTTDSGEGLPDESFEGTTGRVLLPMREGAPGLVVVRRGKREYELHAEPLEPGAPGADEWSQVIVVEMKDGTARVMPMEDPLLTGE